MEDEKNEARGEGEVKVAQRKYDSVAFLKDVAIVSSAGLAGILSTTYMPAMGSLDALKAGAVIGAGVSFLSKMVRGKSFDLEMLGDGGYAALGYVGGVVI